MQSGPEKVFLHRQDYFLPQEKIVMLESWAKKKFMKGN